jgi:valyl-tRNA synthetase
MAKPVLNSDDSDDQKQATRNTLVRVLEAVLRLAHPFMPFITEELWQQIASRAGKTGASVSLQPYPEADRSRIDEAAANDIEWVKQVVMGVRRIRSEMNINPGKRLPVLFSQASQHDIDRLNTHRNLLYFLAKLDAIEVLGAADEEPESAVALVDQLKLMIPMAGLIDKQAELARLGKQIEKLEAEVKRLGAKLANKGFTDKAPATVVANEQTKLEDARIALASFTEQRQKIAEMGEQNE